MKAQPAILISLLVLQGLSQSTLAEPQLKLLHVLFRHGDKVPHKEYQNYPNDPHGNHSYFPLDSGDLTNVGKLREYKIGQVLREEYDGFFGTYYQPSMVYGQSTSLPRTQMSLQLVLAGLFPPNQEQMWNPHLPWLPVATHYVPAEVDGLLFPQSCPEYIKEYKDFLKRRDIQSLILKHKNTMDYLTKHTGKDIQKTSAVYYLYNLFKEQTAQNLSLPQWAYKVYPNPMEEITALDFELRSYTQRLKRLNGGPLLREITEAMRALRAGTLQPASRKAFLYSAHELNVVAMARVLGTNQPAIPLYGSAIILETLQDEAQHYYVRVSLWTGVTEKLINQTIPGCQELCPLDDFLNILKEVIPENKEVNCWSHQHHHHHQHLTASPSSSEKAQTNYITLLMILIILHLIYR